MATTKGKKPRPLTRAEQNHVNAVLTGVSRGTLQKIQSYDVGRFEALVRALENFEGHEVDSNLTRALKVIGAQHPADYARSSIVAMALRGSP